MADNDPVFYKWGGGIDPDFPTVDSAYDEFLVTDGGTEIIDAAAGAAVVNLGHSLPGVGERMKEQADELSYLSLSHFSHEAPQRLARKIADSAPGDLSRVFFTNSGSEANESAFKLARSYFRETGHAQKSTIIGRWQSYHGATLGALAATGNTGRRQPFRSLVPDWPHIPAAYPYRWDYDGTPEEQARAAARELEVEIRQQGHESVAAFIAEPVGGASIPAARPHPAYYEEIRRICDEYDVLFVADEVMTGFGRTGPMFAMEHYDVTPDMLTLGKGLSSGFAPISAVVVREEIAAEFGRHGTGFPHGHTFSGNPLSAAVADHVIDQYTDDVLETGKERGQQLVHELAALEDHPMVGVLRSTGPMVGIEFVADAETGEPFDPSLSVYKRVYEEAFDRGVYTYPGRGSYDGVAGDHMMLSPPLTVSRASVSAIADAVTAAVETVYDDVKPKVASSHD
jgi:adenosylmethionine-8-amino-7-oxononanoate aminotransferase